jgi:hypothetical protein
VLSLVVVVLAFGVDTGPNVVGQTPSDDGPESPVGDLSVKNVGVDVKESVSFNRTDSSVPVSSGWESSTDVFNKS